MTEKEMLGCKADTWNLSSESYHRQNYHHSVYVFVECLNLVKMRKMLVANFLSFSSSLLKICASNATLFISKLLLPRLLYGTLFHQLMERMSLDALFIYYLMWQGKWPFVCTCVCTASIYWSIWVKFVMSRFTWFL